MKKRLFSLLLCGAMVTGMLSGCGSAGSESKTSEVADTTGSTKAAEAETSEDATAGAKTNSNVELTLMINDPSEDLSPKIIQMVEEKFPQYKFTQKNWDEGTVEQTVKTAFAADQAVDIVIYWPTYMAKFEGTGIPLDVSPYLEADAEWKASFAEGALDVGTTEEGILAVPYNSNYPLMQINEAIFKEAGVEVKDKMTWEEFMDACSKISAIGKTPVSVSSDWAGWFVRNGLLQCWKDTTELDSFIKGEIPFTDERVKGVMDNIAGLYTNDYVYPGGIDAVTTSPDDALAAFVNGDVAMYCNVVANCQSVSSTIGSKFDIGLLSWPGMAANDDMNNILGSSSGMMVMSNTKYPDEAVEVLKYLTGDEISQLRADKGEIVPNVNVTSSDKNYAMYSKDSSKVYPDEVINLSSEIFDNLVYNEPSNYLYNGESALDELEVLRGAAGSTK